jgi:fatty-acyl-CoA synthase
VPRAIERVSGRAGARPPREQFRVALTIGFGQTKASPYLTHTRPDDPNPRWVETVRAPLPGTKIGISDPVTGQPLPSGVVGEICARGPGLMTGYFDDPEGTARALDTDGWLHTGDLGSLDEDGYLRLQGRLKDMIIRGGENINPREIEGLLLTHPDVADVSVVGIPDAEMGEQLAAFVHPAAGRGLAPGERRHHVAAHVHRRAHMAAAEQLHDHARVDVLAEQRRRRGVPASCTRTCRAPAACSSRVQSCDIPIG